VQSHEILKEVLQTTSAKQIAADLNLSLSLIYKWAEPPNPDSGGGSSNPLDRIDQLIQSTQDPRIVHWICQRAGGFFVKNPKTTHPHPAFLIPATNSIVQEFADLLAVIAMAAADNHVDGTEAKTIRKRWETLKTVTESFVACCEGGNFSQMRQEQQP